jgi:hypothetical protein
MKKAFAALLCTLALLCTVSAARADQLGIRYHSLDQSNERVEVRCTLNGQLSFDTVDAIRNGVSAKISLSFQLAEAPGLIGMGKQIISERHENYNISYDVWENTFVIEDRRRRTTIEASSPRDIPGKISQLLVPVSLRAASIESDHRLVVRGKVKVTTIKLVPPLGLFLVFFNPWNFESDWIQSKPFTLGSL